MSSGPTIELQVQKSRPFPGGNVVVVNQGKSEIRVWRPGNEWGDEVLSFELVEDNAKWLFVRKPQVYTRNAPSSQNLQPGEAQQLPFDLSDGSWETEKQLQDISPDAKLVAIYNVPVTPEATQHNVWTGRVESNPVTLS